MRNPEFNFDGGLREIIDEHNAWVDEFNRSADAQHKELEKELGLSIPMSPHIPHAPHSLSRPSKVSRFDEDDALLLLSHKSASHGRALRHDNDRGPFLPSGGSLEPGSEWAKRYADEEGPSGMPRWMEPFSKVDLFGHPSVFSDAFDPFKGRK